MDGKIILQTRRLILREFTLSDAQAMFDLNSDSEVIQHTGDNAFENVKEARDFLSSYSDYDRNGFGRWAVISKSTQEFLGWCGLKRNEEALVDLGYRFFKSQWNQGYATESSQACIEYGFHVLGLEQIIARVLPENKASVRVLEKLNMSHWKSGDCEGMGNALYYRIWKG